MAAESSGIDYSLSRTSLWGAVVYPKLSALWRTGFGCDVTIVCQDGSIKAPSTLLATLSPKIRTLVESSADNNVTFTNISVKFWEVLLDLAYSGKLQDHLVYNLSSDFYISLIVQHAFSMTDILALYKHLFSIDEDGTKSLQFSEDLFFKEESAVEYFGTNEDILTTALSSQIESEVRDYFHIAKAEVQLVERTLNNYIGQCDACKDDCNAKNVQCCLCGIVVQRANGFWHMFQNHKFSPSAIWPYTCLVNENMVSVIKGKRIEKLKADILERNSSICMYKCLLCDYVHDNETRFHDHFLTHGFFPEACGYCGDVFSEAEVCKFHTRYCQSNIVLKFESFGDELIGEVDYESDDGQINNDDYNSEIRSDRPTGTYSDRNMVNDPSHFEGECIACFEKCSAENVKCLFCGDVVLNNVKHMVEEHQESTSATEWIYTCIFEQEDEKEREKGSEIVVKRSDQIDEIDLLKCLYCGEVYKDEKMMLLHFRATHGVSRVFYCKYCSTGFKSEKVQACHQQFCGGTSYVKCQGCQVFFENDNQLQEHTNKPEGCWRPNTPMKLKKTQDIGKLFEEKEVDVNESNMDIKNADKSVQSDQHETEPTPRDATACVKCGLHCKAKRVQCFYCQKITDNDPNHMESDHPYTPYNSLWVYTCDIFQLQNDSDEEEGEAQQSMPSWLLFVKKPKTSKRHIYECQCCLGVFPVIEKVIKHMKTKHKVTFIKTCDICKYGFGGDVYHQDHYHFCSGGGLIHCDICDETVGTYQALLLHNVICVQNQHKLNVSDDVSSSCDLKNISGEKRACLMKTAKIKQDTSLTREDKNEIPWMPMCYTCGVDCNEKEVKCIYCLKVVEKSSNHMQHYHPFTPETSLWVYSCNFHKTTKAADKDWIVSFKEPGHVDVDFVNSDYDDMSNFHYCCNKCLSTFKELDDVKAHLKSDHGISVKLCIICHTGFEKIDAMKNHQYFCRGEKLLSCEICSKLVGCYKSYFDHVWKYHPNQRSSVCIYKGPENTISSAVKTSNIITEKLSSPDQVHLDSIKLEMESDLSKSISEDHSDVDNNVLHVEILLKDQDGTEDVQYISVQNVENLKSVKNNPKVSKTNAQDIVQTSTENTQKRSKIVIDNKSLMEQIDELVDPMIREFFEEVETPESGSKNPKCCFTCGWECIADSVKCMYCCKVVSGDLYNHMTHNHPSMSKKVIWAVNCSYFGDDNISPMISEMYSIRKSADSKNKSMHHCVICDDAIFTDQKQLCNHMGEIHKLKSVYFCSICNSGFRYAKKRLSHEQFCSGGNVFKCKACKIIVGSWVLALSHYNAFHENQIFIENQPEETERNFPVVQLDNKYFGIDKQFAVLKRNRGSNHSLVCIYCDIACTAESVRCLYCKEMVDVCNKEMHFKKFHPLTPVSSLWPVGCKFLSKAGRGSSDEKFILSNKYISDGNTYYKCELCIADSFNCIRSIELHMNNVHDLNTYICLQCGLGMANLKGKKVHEYFCVGNDVLQCLQCYRILGNILNCVEHKKACDKRQLKIKRTTILPIKEEEMDCSEGNDTIISADDRVKYGYEIYCGSCQGSCSAPRVRCGLCQEGVLAKDIHMKLKHPYSPCNRWIVFCKFSRMCASRTYALGERIPCVESEKVLDENKIPSKLPSYYKCNYCRRIFAEVGMIYNHIMYAHRHNRKMKSTKHRDFYSMCNSCNMIISNREMYFNHVQYCSTGTLHNCQFCDEVFTTNKLLGTHKKLNHQSEINQKGRLYIPEGTELKCAEEGCIFKTFDYIELKKHNKGIHGYLNYQLYQICRFCYKVFRSMRAREIHQQQDHLNGQRCLCEHCGKDMETPTQLDRHVKYYHEGERENSSIMQKYHRPRKICSLCGHVGTTVSALKQHIKIAHEKKYEECHICGKCYRTTESLRCHLYSHDNIKNYSCPYCSYKAYRGYRINDHVRKVHPGEEQPYKKRLVVHNYLESPMGPISQSSLLKNEDQTMENV